MGIVQVIIDKSTSIIVEGTYTFDRDNGGVLVAPSGTTFPLDPNPGEWFWKTDESRLYRRNDANDAWVAATSAVGLHKATHENDGTDEINVGGLSGELADPQTAKTHALDSAFHSGTISDVQHGNRGNGALHSVATTSVNGFLASTDKTKLDNLNLSLIPSSGEKAALAGTSGTPGDGNRYVTNADSRNSDARTPTAHATSHGEGQSDPITVSQSQVTGLSTALGLKANDAEVVHRTGSLDETVTGIKTFQLSPVVPAPTLDNEAANKGWVAQQIAALGGDYKAGVQALSNLRAIGSTDRADKQIRLVEDVGSLYRFDAQGTGTDDGDFIIVPNDITPPDPGRWFKTQAATQDHEELLGLLGGALNDHYHLTQAQVGYLPSADQKAALAGTSGTPSDSNRYVTNADSRNSNARTPTAHAVSHKTGGTDVILLDEFGTPTDNTNLNVSVSAHGLMPKLPNNAGQYFNGVGSWVNFSDSVSVFGTQAQYESDDTTSTTTGTTLISKLLLTTPSLPAGTYRVGWSMELSVSASNRDYEAVLEVDDVQQGIHSKRAVVANYYATCSGIYHAALTAGIHTCRLLFRRPGGSSTTVSARNARIEFWRIS